METTLSTISVLPSTKEQRFAFFKAMKNEILAADKDPLKILVHLKHIEAVIGDILKDKDIEDHFLREFALYESEKVIEVGGAKLTCQETGTKYLYEDSGDPVWLNLKRQSEELAAKIKERENFLRAIPSDKPGIVDEGTGVFITRPPKTSKTKVVVIL